jgi:hypothetical protein
MRWVIGHAKPFCIPAFMCDSRKNAVRVQYLCLVRTDADHGRLSALASRLNYEGSSTGGRKGDC